MSETVLRLTADTYRRFRSVSVRPEEARLCFGGGGSDEGMLFGHRVKVVDKEEAIPIAQTASLSKIVLRMSTETYWRFRSVPVKPREARQCFGSGLHPLESNTLFRHPVEIVDEGEAATTETKSPTMTSNPCSTRPEPKP